MDKNKIFKLDHMNMLDLVAQIKKVVAQHPSQAATLKQDGTPVTALDLALSDLLVEHCRQHYPAATIFSEEQFSDWAFPLIAIDPLDGTKEYIEQRPEWSISLGIFESERFQGEGWVYNPLTNELYDGSRVATRSSTVLVGEVSRTEWAKGWYSSLLRPGLEFRPRGSIAYKLGRLSAGEIDFVVSLAPKHIWDVAGGSLLCQAQGIKFYSRGHEVTQVQRLYEPPLIWCREEIFSELSSLFPWKDKDL